MPTSPNTFCKVTHKIFGVPQTINTANYVYFQAFQELFKFRNRNRGGPSESPQQEGSSRMPQPNEVYLDEVITGKFNVQVCPKSQPLTEMLRDPKRN